MGGVAHSVTKVFKKIDPISYHATRIALPKNAISMTTQALGIAPQQQEVPQTNVLDMLAQQSQVQSKPVSATTKDTTYQEQYARQASPDTYVNTENEGGSSLLASNGGQDYFSVQLGRQSLLGANSKLGRK